MWTKLTHAWKPRSSHSQYQEESDNSAQIFPSDATALVDQRPPNTSLFQGLDSTDLGSSTPDSSSRSTEKGLLRRLSRKGKEDSEFRSTLSRFPLSIPKKVKSFAGLSANGSQSSLPHTPTSSVSHGPYSQSSQDSDRPSFDSLRSEDLMPLGERPFDEAQEDLQVQDLDEETARLPLMPNSVRSILRNPKTPGTGQSVRFHGKDAFKVISPDQSMNTEPSSQMTIPAVATAHQQAYDKLTLMERLQNANQKTSPPISAASKASSTSSRSSHPSITEVFSMLTQDISASSLPSNDHPSSARPMSPPNFGELSPIHPALGTDGKRVIFDSPELDISSISTHGRHAFSSTPFRPRNKKVRADVNKSGAPEVEKGSDSGHSRTQSLSFGTSVFFSAASKDKQQERSSIASSLASEQSTESLSRATRDSWKHSRALSDTVFHSMLRSSSKTSDTPQAIEGPFAGTNPPLSPPPDPFNAKANTYYTPQTMIPTTPPPGTLIKKIQKASKQESIIANLQTQLTLQTELCNQYETDLRTRDEMLEMLNKRVGGMEKEDYKRRSALRQWKKKVAELEKSCRYLEDEIDNSRQESMERSVLDETSGETLRILQRQVTSLERERGAWKQQEGVLREEIQTLEKLVKERSDDIQQLNEALWNREETEKELKDGLKAARKHVEGYGNPGSNEQGRGSEWGKTKEELLAHLEILSTAKDALEVTISQLRKQLGNRDQEYALLKSELEAQWSHTEKASDQVQALRQDKENLKQERDNLNQDVKDAETKIANMEVDWNESENKRNELEQEYQELWSLKESLERDKEELEDQMHHERERAEELSSALQQHETRIDELNQEHQFSNETIERLEENIRKRDQEIEELSQCVSQQENDTERLKDEISTLKREHKRALEEHSRTLRAASGQEGETKTHLEELIKQKAELDVEVNTARERLDHVQQEVDKLRRNVHELKQESADKEVKIVQLSKQRARDKEDINGLNIALDSKQQELEMMKRRLGRRGTAGATPAPGSQASVPSAINRRDSSVSRRESFLFSATPAGFSRPSSAMSNASSTTSARGRRSSVDATPSISARPVTLGTRTNTASAAPLAIKKSNSNTTTSTAVRPTPASKVRSSSAGSPTPTAKPAGRSASAKFSPPPSVTPIARGRNASSYTNTVESTSSAATAAALRAAVAPRAKPVRATSGTLEASESENEEKENVEITTTIKRRNMFVPTPA